MFISTPSSSAININGLFVNLFEIITSVIFSLSSFFKTLIKSLILVSLFISLFLILLSDLNLERSTLPLVIDLNFISL